MKVVSFDQNEFDFFLENKLSNFLVENETCLVIGIEEGGMPLAEIVADKFKKKSVNVTLLGVKCQRPSTKTKKNTKILAQIFRKLLKNLPIAFTNLLRNIEHHFLMKNNVNTSRNVIINDSIDFSKYNKILIVDDAVDSGYSLKNVIDRLKQETSVDLYSLCVVVTNKNTCIWPDFYLHSEVLIRFPWSLDG